MEREKSFILHHRYHLHIGVAHHPTRQAKQQVQSGFTLDVVISKCAGVNQFLASKSQTLPGRMYRCFFFDLLLDNLNRTEAIESDSDYPRGGWRVWIFFLFDEYLNKPIASPDI